MEVREEFGFCRLLKTARAFSLGLSGQVKRQLTKVSKQQYIVTVRVAGNPVTLSRQK